jgi:selenocysteine lyase/cysteine desulfurase
MALRIPRRRIRLAPVEPMPSKFGALARYNAEVHRGVTHTPEWETRMAALQAEYRQWLNASRPPH